MKDYLEQEGFDVRSPRSVLQTAFQNGLISDGHIWIDMLEKRNMMEHTYNEQYAHEAERLIRKLYYDALKKLVERLDEEI